MLVHPYRFFLGLLGYSIAVTIPFFSRDWRLPLPSRPIRIG